MIVSERKNDNKEILRDLFQNDEYISWVTNETNNGYVTDILNEIHYSNKEEQRKTNLLKYFYEGTKSYAYHNNISPSADSLGEYYTVKYNDHNYDIGRLVQGIQSIYYFRKSIILDIADMDFEDIKNNIELIITQNNSKSL